MSELLLSTIVVSVNDKKLGIKLKQARLASGLSQEKVANKLGVTWEMVSRYENGRSSPLKHLKKLVSIYDKPISFFMEDDEGETFRIDDIVQKLKDEGIGYSSNTRNVIKMIQGFSGKGIEVDLKDSKSFYEVSTSLTDQFSNLFALEIAEEIDLNQVENIERGDICFFQPGMEPIENDVVIAFDGVSYKIMQYDGKGIDTPLAVLVGLERRFKTRS